MPEPDICEVVNLAHSADAAPFATVVAASSNLLPQLRPFRGAYGGVVEWTMSRAAAPASPRSEEEDAAQSQVSIRGRNIDYRCEEVELGSMIRIAVGRVLLWLILPAAEEKWERDAATCRLADGPLLHFPRDPLIFPTCRDDP